MRRGKSWVLDAHSTCLVCDQDPLPGDVIVKPVVGTGHGGRAAHRSAGRWAHLCCTREGVRRWLREGRPGPHPLLWDRAERPAWHAREAPQGRTLRVLRTAGERLHARPVAGRTLSRPDPR